MARTRDAWDAAAAAAGGSSSINNEAMDEERALVKPLMQADNEADALMKNDSAAQEPPTRTNFTLVALMSVAVVTLGACDRIAYKVMLVPLTQYPFFITLISSVMYTMIYGPILLWQSRLHKFSLTAPLKKYWHLFIAMGLLDALGDSLGLVGARHISGALLTLLPKIIIPMTMLFSYLILKVKYTWWEAAASVVVLGGVTIALVPDLRGGLVTHDSASSQIISIIIYMLSVAPSALSFVLKELVFRREPSLNVFVISFYGSAFELLITFVLIPLSAIPGFGHVPLSQLPYYIQDGFMCWTGQTPHPDVAGAACFGDPLAPLVYHFFNLSWNISLIILLKIGSATTMFVVNTVKFPIANLLFGISWPLLGADKGAFAWSNIVGLVVEMTGVVLFQAATQRREKLQALSEKDRRRQRSLSASHTHDIFA